jgi:serine protease AprX
MGVSGTTFGPTAQVSRLEQAVAMVRALRMDADARALAGSTVTAVTSNGTRQPLTDNADIPTALRGYVQVALDQGLMQAYPAAIIQTGPGQFIAVPGPRFEPTTLVKRSDFAASMIQLLAEMFGE